MMMLLLMLHDVHPGGVMILVRFITVANRTVDVHSKRANVVSLIIGSLSTVGLSLVANFPEGQRHGVGDTHEAGAGVLFTCSCVFIVIDTVITLRTRFVEARDADQPQQHCHWLRSLRWFEWIRPIIAVLAVVLWILCILCYYI